MSLSRIASKIDSDTFYWDLLFWLVVPDARVEEMLGDLGEEYLIRASNNEVAKARAWYRHQVVKSASDYFWERIVRIAAVGALIDLIRRWFGS